MAVLVATESTVCRVGLAVAETVSTESAEREAGVAGDDESTESGLDAVVALDDDVSEHT